MFKKFKMFLGELLAKSFNLIIELLENLRDFFLALMGEYELRACSF